MEIYEAVERLSALAQEHRLKIFRLLICVGPTSELAAGEIGAAMDLAPATLSFHLKELSRAHLIRSRREGRSILYSADIQGTEALMHFLTEDCCQGRPELCGETLGGKFCTPQSVEKQ